MNNYYGYNGYPQYPQGYQSNMQRQGQMYNAPMAQPQPMPMQPQQPMQYDMPINYVGYTNLKEAEGHILFPNQKAIFIDKANGMVYEKICGNDGLSSMTHYKRVEAQGENQAVEPQKQEPTIDLSNYVQKDDLKGFVSLKDYNTLILKVEDLKKQLGGKANVGTINQ
jgi:hypothetical protein